MGIVVVGVHGVGSHQARHWAELAAEDGADGVLCLPPTMYRANQRRSARTTSRRSPQAGLPVMVYNNPIDTKVDLTPDLLAEIAQIENVVAVKEFSGDVRRVLEIRELAAATWTVIAGADDLALESAADGRDRLVRRVPQRRSRPSRRRCSTSPRQGKLDEARALYEPLVAAFRWDSRTEFVQAIKLRHGLRRPVRRPVPPAARPAVTGDAGAGRRRHGAGDHDRTRQRRAADEVGPVRSAPSTRTPRACRPGSSPAASASIPGATMAERRGYFVEHLDDLRRFLVNEPRGHPAMSGAILQPPTRPDADWGVLYVEVVRLPADVRARHRSASPPYWSRPAWSR